MSDRAAAGHLAEDDLVLLHYGESKDRTEAARHLAACAACRERRDRLGAVLAAVDSVQAPHRDDLFAARVWRRLEPHLTGAAAARPPTGGRTPRVAARWWALAAAGIVMLAAGYMAGRLGHAPGVPPSIAGPIDADARERILLVAVGDHLDRSQMVLLELLNEGDLRPEEVGPRQQSAQDLVVANRILRQSAAASGDGSVAIVLEELERVLLDVAHGPARPSQRELEALRRRIEDRGILFKVRVIGSQVRERGRAASSAPPGGRT